MWIHFLLLFIRSSTLMSAFFLQSGTGPSPRGKRGPSHTPKQHRDRGIDFYFSRSKNLWSTSKGTWGRFAENGSSSDVVTEGSCLMIVGKCMFLFWPEYGTWEIHTQTGGNKRKITARTASMGLSKVSKSSAKTTGRIKQRFTKDMNAFVFEVRGVWAISPKSPIGVQVLLIHHHHPHQTILVCKEASAYIMFLRSHLFKFSC